MVKVWFVREGSDPTQGEPQYDLPLEQCSEQLGLEKKHWLHGLDRTPRFQAPRSVLCGAGSLGFLVLGMGLLARDGPAEAQAGWW